MYFATFGKVLKYIDVAYKFDFMSFANQNQRFGRDTTKTVDTRATVIR